MAPPDYRTLSKADLLQRRKEGGRWLKELREAVGISQRELAERIGADYYSFVSQIEGGKGAIHPTKVYAWAKALNADEYVFASNILRYYEPQIHAMMYDQKEFTEDDSIIPLEKNYKKSTEESMTNDIDELENIRSRLARLEALLIIRGAEER